MAEIYTYDKTLQNLIKRLDTLEADADLSEMVYTFENRQKRKSEPPRIIKMLGILYNAPIGVKSASINGLWTLIKDEVTNLIIEINDNSRAPLIKRDYRIALRNS